MLFGYLRRSESAYYTTLKSVPRSNNNISECNTFFLVEKQQPENNNDSPILRAVDHADTHCTVSNEDET